MAYFEFLKEYTSANGTQLGTYQLPGNPQQDRYIIPVSGGADSMVLAVILTSLFPIHPFEYAFTDTQVETPEIYAVLERFENVFGKTIIRLGDMGFFDLIEKFGGFLPSIQAKWCTRELKIKPFESYLDSLGDQLKTGTMIYSFAGIRADEAHRPGLEAKRPFIRPVKPLVEMGIDRQDVFAILNQTLGVPSLYKHRTRSGCSTCPFQRKSEVLGLLRWNKSEFLRGMEYEKPCEADRERFPENAVQLWRETSISRNHCLYPVPPEIDPEAPRLLKRNDWSSTNPRQDTAPHRSLFPELDEEKKNSLYVGVEFFTFANWDGSIGIYWQELVTLSSTKAGLVNQLRRHYEHRRQTSGVYLLDEEEMTRELTLAVYRIAVSADLLDSDPVSKDSFTWAGTYSYAQLRHQFAWAERTLHFHALKQRLEEYQKMPNDLWAIEQAEECQKLLSQISDPVGDLLAMGTLDVNSPKHSLNHCQPVQEHLAI